MLEPNYSFISALIKSAKWGSYLGFIFYAVIFAADDFGITIKDCKTAIVALIHPFSNKVGNPP